jgi:ribonuclease P protein component
VLESGTTPRVGAISSRRTFEAIRRSSFRGRSGPLSVSFLQEDSWSRSEVAYAISRRVGNAVVRNRTRRRLRAIISELAPFLPTGAYVVRVGPEGPALDFNELKVTMRQALEKATRSARRSAPSQDGVAPR